VVKQALDIGLMGVIFNGVESKEQALLAVRSMRYPQLKGSNHMEPAGTRGYGTTGATWVWGLNAAEYARHADVWPLDPDGDLLATIMIESVEGLKHLDEIAAVPGVGALFLGAGADLSRSLGVPQNAPEVEAGFQQVLRACIAHKVPCAITAGSAADVAKRVREGFRIIRSTVPAITAGRALLGER
jgi:4-hydroxy-2-oxoheptanedioate aldolase